MAEQSGLSRAARNLIVIYLRLALGVDFLSAVADRFGLWGRAGSDHVMWGNFPKFVAYTARLDPFTPARSISLVAWIITGAEVLLGLLLILGLFTRVAAMLSGVMLALFGVGMSLGTGAKSAFDSAVFAASAGAFALAALGSGACSIDARKRRRKAAAPPPPAPVPASAGAGGQGQRPSGG